MSNTASDNKKLSEFELIKYLTKNIKIQNKETVFGIGDDAAVLKYVDKQIVLQVIC